MHYTQNINLIDSELKKIFEDVKIDSNDYRSLYITLKTPLLENINKKIELSVYVNQSNLNSENPSLVWGYYTNPNERINSIQFMTKTSDMSRLLEEVITDNRLDILYLESLTIDEIINESSTNDDVIILDNTYMSSDDTIEIYTENLKKFFEKTLSVDIDKIILKEFDENGDIVKWDKLAIGESIFELELSKFTSKNKETISSKDWLEIDKILKSLPNVEDIYSNKGALSESLWFKAGSKVKLL